MESILLEELEGLDAASTIGEEETQVVLSNSLPARQNHSHNHHHTAKAAASNQALGVTLQSTASTTIPDIGEVKCGRGREDVLKVFGSRFLESVEGRTREVCLVQTKDNQTAGMTT